MLISEDQHDGQYIINGFQPGTVIVNDQYINHSIVISASQLIAHWQPNSLNEVNCDHFEKIISWKPELLLIGTGATFKRLPNSLTQLFDQHHIAYEPMASAAACRSFMAVLAEDRKVVAAILIE